MKSFALTGQEAALFLLLSLLIATTVFAEGKTALLNDLDRELSHYERLSDYEKMSKILMRELRSYPRATAEILKKVEGNQYLYSYFKSERKLKVIIDNGFQSRLDVLIGDRHSFSIPLLSHECILLAPEEKDFIFSCPEEGFLRELSIPVISPPSERDHLIINVGRINDYRILLHERSLGQRKVPSIVEAWPFNLSKPEYFYLPLDELFPKLPKRIHCKRNPRARNANIIALYRIRPEGIH